MDDKKNPLKRVPTRITRNMDGDGDGFGPHGDGEISPFI